MSKFRVPSPTPLIFRDKSFLIFVIVTILLVFVLFSSFTDSNWSNFLQKPSFEDCSFTTISRKNLILVDDDHPQEKTFYDDPKLTYTINSDEGIKNWDEKRKHWLILHPSFGSTSNNRVLLLSGSQSSPCRSPSGDHLLLRCFKNKVDYCRVHGHDIFYSNVHFNPEMKSFWTKIPLVRSAMVAHPEAEWIWWMDSDAIFTDMDFKVPFRRYKNYNFVIHGWPNLIYEKKSWVAINAGIFLIRNCQWSMEFLEAWSKMGPQSSEYEHWGEIQRSTFKDKLFPESDDQSALVYLLLKEKKKWGHKMYVENKYALHGYWVGIVGTLENVTRNYLETEKKVAVLRRRRAEVASEAYGKLWELYLRDDRGNDVAWRRPFITHFTGCQPCSGAHNPAYDGNSCWDGMDKALNFADNQVLRNYGFMHADIPNSSILSPLRYNFPAD